MSDGVFRLEARPLDDPDTVDRLNYMIASIQAAKGSPYRDAMVEELMREVRKAMRRGLLEGADEIMDECGDDPFYEEDECEN